jgi:hypothetical protein
VALADDFLNLPSHDFEARIAIGAAGEADLAGQFRQAGWPVRDVNRAEVGAQHPPLWVGNQQIKLPDLMVRFPVLGWCFIECRTKRKGTIPGTDCYGMNTSKDDRNDRWEELLLVDDHAGNAALAIFDPAHGWLIATVSKLRSIGLRKHRGGEYWLIPRDCMTPLRKLLHGDLACGLVLHGRAV